MLNLTTKIARDLHYYMCHASGDEYTAVLINYERLTGNKLHAHFFTMGRFDEVMNQFGAMRVTNMVLRSKGKFNPRDPFFCVVGEGTKDERLVSVSGCEMLMFTIDDYNDMLRWLDKYVENAFAVYAYDVVTAGMMA